MRIILFITGWLAAGLGALGAFMPLLPTTPFLLLAAACFARSSPQAQQWLLNSPCLGPVLRNYLEHRVVTRRAKVAALLMLWPSVGWSATRLVPVPVASAGLVLLAIIITVFLCTRPSVAAMPGK